MSAPRMESQPGNASGLLPCPFCGTSDSFVEREDFTSSYVQCDHCLARGPVECQESDDEEIPGKSAAELSWNTRIDPTPDARCGVQTEPVAWRVRNDFGHWHTTNDSRIAETWAKIEKLEVQPLYLSPSLSSADRGSK